jgi:hypothetical protein
MTTTAALAGTDSPALSRWGKALVIVLTLYALAVVAPDTLRVFPGVHEIPWLARWYPLGTLGFEADNDGNIVAVEPGSPAADAGITEGDAIDLAAMIDRRAVNKFVFVAHDHPHTLWISRRGQPAVEIIVQPVRETASYAEAFALLAAQVAALFFVALAAILVWRHPTPQTWGLFLYSLWYNSGQYFVWYANLSVRWLIAFDALQIVAEAAGLVGILLFALYFPRDSVSGWRRTAERLLLLPFGALLIVGLWKFRNFTHAEPTEIAYRLYYVLTYVMYATIFALFALTYRTQVEQRPRIRWVILGALWGLLCFLLADTYEATALLAWLHLPQWSLDLLYAQSVWLPLAVFYAIRRHRVIKVRFAITRTLVFGAVVMALAALLEIAQSALESLLMRSFTWLQRLRIPLLIALSVSVTWADQRGHRVVEWLLFRRWHEAEKRLRAVAEQIADADDLDLDAVNRAVVDEPVAALGLTAGALLRRADGGAFECERSVGWPPETFRVLAAADPIVTALGRDPLRLDGVDWTAHARPPDLATPALAVPIVVRRTLERVVLFGPHVDGQDLDRDEIKVLHELARAAAMAYTRLRSEALERELERLKAPDGPR